MKIGIIGRSFAHSIVAIVLLTISCTASQTPIVDFITENPTPPKNKSADFIPGKQLVIMVNGNRAGFVNYHGYASDSTTAGLYTFYIYPQYRSKGYAQRLLKETIKRLSAQGYARIILEPGPFEYDATGKSVDLTGEPLQEAMAKLIRLYQKVGFRTDPQNPVNMVYVVPKKQDMLIPLIAGSLVAMLILISLLFLMRRRTKKL